MRLIIRNFIRIFQRFKLAMGLNLLGLAIAYVAFLLLMMQWNYDREFDRHDPNAEFIYRIDMGGGDRGKLAVICRPLAEMMMQSSPHIQAGCLINSWEFDPALTIEQNGVRNTFKESMMTVSDGFTDVFHFDLVEGEVNSLTDMKHILIPLSLSRKWFGNESAVGKMAFNEQGKSVTVCGVYRDSPKNSTISNVIYGSMGNENKQEWSNWNYNFYIRTDLNDTQAIQELIDSYLNREDVKNSDERLADGVELFAVALPDIHSYEPVLYDNTPRTSKQTMMLIFSIAIVILLIAGINYTNFSTAISPLRMKNINTQKVLGATSGELRRDLLTESVIVSLFAYLLGILILWNLEQTTLNQLVKADIHIWNHPFLLLITAGIAIVLGLLAGLYPAYYTTSFEPALVLKGSFGLSPKGRMLRNLLMGFQFIASFALIIGSLFMYLQNRYTHTASLGYDKEALIVSDLSWNSKKSCTVLENQLKTHPEIAEVTFTQHPFAMEGDVYMNWGREYKDKDISFNVLCVSPSFPDVVGLKPKEGRNFREGDQQMKFGAFLINEKMQKEYGIQVGDMIDSMQVVGVVPDYIYGSMRRSITPTALMVYGKQMIEWNGGSPENTYAYMYVKTQKGVNLDDALHIVRGELEKVDPDYPFDVRFFDDVLNQLYKNEQRLTTLITLFSLLAVFISVVGVFGLVVFDSESRRKEIGVRKVLGSTTGEILWMFNKNYLRILVVCFIIASPFAWYGVNGWLQNFAYKIPIYWWVFLIAFLLVSVVTLLTVTYQNWHAANENPVNSIKNE